MASKHSLRALRSSESSMFNGPSELFIIIKEARKGLQGDWGRSHQQAKKGRRALMPEAFFWRVRYLTLCLHPQNVQKSNPKKISTNQK